MKKWSLAFATMAMATVAIVGCGGSGGDGGGGTTPVEPGFSQARVNLPNVPGLVNFTYLPGQGRAAGQLIGVIRRQELSDGPDPENIVSERLQTELRLNLSTYDPDTRSLNVPGNPPTARFTSRLFDNYTLDIQSLLIDNGGSFTPVVDPSGQPIILERFNARIRAFPGRQTTVPVFIDDAMIRPNSTNDGAVFSRAAFERSNYNALGRMEGFLGDYVQFDITNVPSKPTLSGGRLATSVYFSGDQIAVSGRLPGPFEVLVPEAGTRVQGNGGAFVPLAKFGTYALTQTDPSDVGQTARITSVQGIWRPYTDVVTNMNATGFEFIVFPDRLESGIFDLVLIRRERGVISNMYFGVVNLSNTTNSGLAPNRFRAWPLRNATLLPPANRANEIGGTVENLVKVIGSDDTGEVVMEGIYNIAATGRPAGFSPRGRFIVFRR